MPMAIAINSQYRVPIKNKPMPDMSVAMISIRIRPLMKPRRSVATSFWFLLLALLYGGRHKAHERIHDQILVSGYEKCGDKADQADEHENGQAGEGR